MPMTSVITAPTTTFVFVLFSVMRYCGVGRFSRAQEAHLFDVLGCNRTESMLFGLLWLHYNMHIGTSISLVCCWYFVEQLKNYSSSILEKDGR